MPVAGDALKELLNVAAWRLPSDVARSAAVVKRVGLAGGPEHILVVAVAAVLALAQRMVARRPVLAATQHSTPAAQCWNTTHAGQATTGLAETAPTLPTISAAAIG
jgi:hypothetical protein